MSKPEHGLTNSPAGVVMSKVIYRIGTGYVRPLLRQDITPGSTPNTSVVHPDPEGSEIICKLGSGSKLTSVSTHKYKAVKKYR